ncbi:hypothetical protein AcW1_005058 [Taiwanofungus camphoratus]|nr:hypothetical protein AcW2_005932 [Antrodia cinnamomea]KAI0941157.1 hypothetical protein AcV7_002799 [Antrodia cinnamomea]KAI0960579.1 hypothetical protein AcW1_005058 [Antrodia cinnamomea]
MQSQKDEAAGYTPDVSPGQSATTGTPTRRFRDRLRALASLHRPRIDIEKGDSPVPKISPTQKTNGDDQTSPPSVAVSPKNSGAVASEAATNAAPLVKDASASDPSDIPESKLHRGKKGRRSARGSHSDKLGYKVERYASGISATDVAHGWTRYVHLNGSVYYYNSEYEILTPDDMENDEQRRAVMNFRKEFLETLEEDGLFYYTPGKYDLLIRDAYDDDHVQAIFLSYDESTQIVFPDRGPDVEIQGYTYSYWCALEEHPMHRARLPLLPEEDFVWSLTYGAAVGIFEEKDTEFPYTDAQIEQLMQIYRNLKHAAKTNRDVMAPLNWLIARTVRDIEMVRERGKNTEKPGFSWLRKPSEETSTWRLEVAEMVLFLALFGVHRMYFGRLRRVRVGQSAYLLDFRKVLQQFLAEWSDSNLLATVFVGANVAFQQLPGLNGLQRTASLASAVFSVLGVATGVHHVWQHRAKVNADIDEAVKYVNHARDWDKAGNESSEVSDLLWVSSFLAVPIAALFWAVLSFTIALGAYCVQSVSMTGTILLAVVLGICALVSLAMLVFFRSGLQEPRGECRTSMLQTMWKTSLLRFRGTWQGLRRRALNESDEQGDGKV